MNNFLVVSIFAIFSTNIFFAITLKNVQDSMDYRREALPNLKIFKHELDETFKYLTNTKTQLLEMSDMINGEKVEIEGGIFALNLFETKFKNAIDINTAKELESKIDFSSDLSKRNAIKEATKFAWDSYVKYAWGKDELHPISKTGHSWMGLGLTIIDSIDTLWIMDLKQEYQQARDFIEKVNFEVDFSASVFEMNIRILGGLLSCYSLTGDEMFLRRSKEFGDILMHAFSTSVFPSPSLNLKTKVRGRNGYFPGNYILSEIGSLQMEFCTLSYFTKDDKYCKATLKILDSLEKKAPNAVYLSLWYESTEKAHDKLTIGGLSDSFYEYLLKMWIMTDKNVGRFRNMYDKAVQVLKDKIVQKVDEETYYFSQVHETGENEQKMEHLACFGGGMFGLGAITGTTNKEIDMKIGSGITKMCYDMYQSNPSKVGPEDIRVINGRIVIGASFYYLRPEAVESIFYYWRFTHQQKYRDWGWDIFLALNSSCRSENGFHGLHNVQMPGSKVDNQESFFIAETLKYLYLLFSEDSLIDLNEWVFNTEAHPLPILKDPKNFLYLFEDFQQFPNQKANSNDTQPKNDNIQQA